MFVYLDRFASFRILKGVPAMNNQDAFDTTLTNLMNQGICSMTPYHCCRYRGPNGTKCAVGHLIPDDLYSKDIEGMGAISLCGRPLYKSFFNGVNTNLLRAMQIAHDTLAISGGAPTQWRNSFWSSMKDVAKKWSLNQTVLNQMKDKYK